MEIHEIHQKAQHRELPGQTVTCFPNPPRPDAAPFPAHSFAFLPFADEPAVVVVHLHDAPDGDVQRCRRRHQIRPRLPGVKTWIEVSEDGSVAPFAENFATRLLT